MNLYISVHGTHNITSENVACYDIRTPHTAVTERNLCYFSIFHPPSLVFVLCQ
jgi:hypothetical protein